MRVTPRLAAVGGRRPVSSRTSPAAAQGACSVGAAWHRDHESHYVVDVRPVPSVPVRCVQVGRCGSPLPRRAVDDPDAQLHPGAGRRPARRGQAPPGVGDLLAGDVQDRDHHAAAVGGGRDPVVADAVRVDERAGLAEDRPADERDLRRAAVHRRLAEHDDDGDPGEGAAAQAAQRPEVDRGGLPAADDVGQAGGVAAAGGQRVLPADEAAGQGTRGAGDRDLASSTVVRSSAPTSGRCCRICASPVRWSRTPTW